MIREPSAYDRDKQHQQKDRGGDPCVQGRREPHERRDDQEQPDCSELGRKHHCLLQVAAPRAIGSRFSASLPVPAAHSIGVPPSRCPRHTVRSTRRWRRSIGQSPCRPPPLPGARTPRIRWFVSLARMRLGLAPGLRRAIRPNSWVPFDGGRAPTLAAQRGGGSVRTPRARPGRCSRTRPCGLRAGSVDRDRGVMTPHRSSDT
jgi:hypothetical protein